jgi:hypothetical protein
LQDQEQVEDSGQYLKTAHQQTKEEEKQEAEAEEEEAKQEEEAQAEVEVLLHVKFHKQ